MEVCIEQFPEYPVVYLRRTGAYGKENFELMTRLKEWTKEHNLWNSDTTIYGIARDNAQTTAPENCRYDVCLVVTQDCPSDGVIQKGEIPGGKYAVFTVEHTSEAVQSFWGSLFTEIEKMGLAFDASRPILERYRNRLIEAGYCEFCVPLAD